MLYNKCVTIFVLCTIVSVTQGQFVPIFDWVRSFFGYYEEPTYTSVRNITDDVEERLYPSQNWACVEYFATPEKKDSKSSENFMLLFSYIQGKNDIAKKIEMTIPVSTKVDHRNGEVNSYEMCFFIPQEYQNNPPIPTNTKVKVIKFPELHVYSKRYGGYASEEINRLQQEELASVLKNNSISYFEQNQGPRATHFINGYDSPTKFWSRRNELWLLSSDTKKIDFIA